MNHDVLKTVIFDQHVVICDAEILRREILLEPDANAVLTGLRRAGKSTMLYQLVRDLVSNGVPWNRIIYINFEDERLTEFTRADFNDVLAVQSELSSEKGFFFFDEIQNIPGWEKFARRLADAKERVWITGSNAKMLSREFASVLGGRYLEKIIRPYSFREVLKAASIPHAPEDLLATKARGRIAAALKTYLHDGGLPESLLYTPKREYLSSVYQKVLLGDIAARNNLRNDTALRLLIKKVAETVMREVSYTRLHGELKAIGLSISKDTVIDYLSFAADAYLLFTVRNRYAVFSEREGTPKYYFSDNGLLNLFLIEKDSALLENLVAIELSRRYGEAFFYMKSAKTGVDVDFFVPEEEAAIQVCYTLNESANEREINNLIRLKKSEPGIRRLLIVTKEEEGNIRLGEDEIRILPLDRFLLQGIAAAD